MKESPPTKFKSTQKHQAGASKPFSLNPTGTLSRRHFAQFVSAIDRRSLRMALSGRQGLDHVCAEPFSERCQGAGRQFLRKQDRNPCLGPRAGDIEEVSIALEGLLPVCRDDAGKLEHL